MHVSSSFLIIENDEGQRRLSRLLKESKPTQTDSHFFDALTQVYTRAYFDEALHREVARANRHQQEFAILIVDVDHMGKLNCRCGKLTGDQCLKELAAEMKKSVRAGDLVARYGGDEFVILLERCRPLDAIQCAHRIQECVEVIAARTHFTVTVGLLHYEGQQQSCPPEQLISRTTQAIHKAQQAGGNRLTIAA